MVIKLYTADVKLNKTDKDYHKYLIMVTPEGEVLMVNKGLFSISFDNLDAAFNQDVEVINKSYLRDIYL